MILNKMCWKILLVSIVEVLICCGVELDVLKLFLVFERFVKENSNYLF